MKRNFLKILSLPFAALLVSGCATTRPRPAETQQNTQMQAMQTQLDAKDQEIQDLRGQLERQQTFSNNFASSAGGSSDKYNILRVSGVSAMEVQKALVRAGFDPGPVDGRLGKKTRTAVKAFQKNNHLTADGVIGEKTWALLRSS